MNGEEGPAGCRVDSLTDRGETITNHACHDEKAPASRKIRYELVMSTMMMADSVNLRLALIGLPLLMNTSSEEIKVVAPVLARQRELRRELPKQRCPADRRVQAFLDRYLGNCSEHSSLPDTTLVLDESGLARTLSLPVDGDEFHSELVESFRVANGVLHNPRNAAACKEIDAQGRMEQIRAINARARRVEYRQMLEGTLGRQAILR